MRAIGTAIGGFNCGHGYLFLNMAVKCRAIRDNGTTNKYSVNARNILLLDIIDAIGGDIL